MKRFSLILVFLLCITTVVGCAGNKRNAKKSEAEANVPDITRPPSLVVDTSDQAAESNPDETVSFDKWNKDKSEQEKQAQPE